VTTRPRSVDTAVIGAGQAGLMMSWHLQRAGREHVVLDRRETVGGGWHDRWDRFRLVSPNWTTAYPGFPYDGPDPDAFMDRDSVIDRVRAYGVHIGAPVQGSTEVRRLTSDGGAGRLLRLETSQGPLDADQVIVATGGFHSPRIPTAGAGLSSRVLQLHSHDYRNPAQLPPGGVLVVGTGQTGVQLVEELHAAGRDVVLSIGRCGQSRRTYRGRDFFWWVRRMVDHGPEVGVTLPTVGQLPDPRARFACNPHLSGHDGGHDTNLRQMALDGIRLAGRFAGATGETVRFDTNLRDTLRFADEFFDARFRPLFDRYADQAGLEFPTDERVWPTYEPPELPELDLAGAGISTVLWATGYAPDYGWIDLPIHDEFGMPRQERGISDVPGLMFIGMLFMHDNASANLAGLARDADYLAARW
jgi:putative flavoprotein involved in K+ transport